jgi:ABC-type phosphate transport system substrate-binding protein
VTSQLPANIRRSAMIVAAISVLALPARAATFNGAGGTAIYPLLSKWADAYAAKTGNMINYQAIARAAALNRSSPRPSRSPIATCRLSLTFSTRTT